MTNLLPSEGPNDSLKPCFPLVDQSVWRVEQTFSLHPAPYKPISILLIGAGAHVWIQGHHYLLKDLCRPPVG